MTKKIRVLLTALAFLLISNFSYSQQYIPIFDEVEESPRHWTVELLRTYMYYAMVAAQSNSSLISIQSVPSDPYYSSSGSWGQSYDDMWGLKKINIENAWKLSTGEGAVVAVLDSGIDYNHPDINDNIWTNTAELNGLSGVDDDHNGYIDDVRGWDFYNIDNNPIDDNGHGTHVAGIIAAEGNNDEGIIGVAYKAKTMIVKMLNSSGSTDYYDRVAASIRYAVDMGARILNCSFGGGYSSVVNDAFKYAYDKGAIIIVAAGNDNSNTSSYYPASLNYVVTVSAIGTSNGRATYNGSYYSNYGSAVDVAAPGDDILSLRAAGTDMFKVNPGYIPGDYFVPRGDANAEYYRSWGTSMATPFVSGLAALMLSQDSDLTFAEFSRRLKFSSYDLGAVGWDQYYGWGRLDAFKALSYDWYDSGVIRTHWLTEADPDNVVRYDYYENEVIEARQFAEPDADNVIRYEYFESGSTKSKQFYTPDLFNVIKYSFFQSGRLDSKLLYSPDGTGNKLYSYYDENFSAGTGRLYISESSSGARYFSYGYVDGTATCLVTYIPSAWSGSAAATEFDYYDANHVDILHKRFEFNNSDIADANILPGGNLQITKFYDSAYKNTTWFLWGSKVYKGYDNVVIEHTSGIAIETYINIPDGSTLGKMAVSSDGKFLYVAAYTFTTVPGTVKVIDIATNSVLSSIKVGIMPKNIVMNPNGNFLYVTNNSSGTVSVIDATTNAVVASIVVGTQPSSEVITPDGNFLYVANTGSDNVSVINTSTNVVVATISVGDYPDRILVTPKGDNVYVVNSRSKSISIIDNASKHVVGTINVPAYLNIYTYDIVASPDGNYIYFVMDDIDEPGRIMIINNNTRSVAYSTTISHGLEKIVITPDGKYALVSTNSDKVYMYNIATNVVERTFNLDFYPDLLIENMVIASDGKYLYVDWRNLVSSSQYPQKEGVSVINLATNSVEKNIAITNSAYSTYRDITATPDGKHVFISNSWENNITKLDTDSGWYAYYGFNPNPQNPADILNDSIWRKNFIENILDPTAIQSPLPELGNWEEYCALKDVTAEFPAVSTDYQYDGQGKIIERLDHNDYNDVKYVYTWDTVNGKMAEKIYYEKDGVSTLVSITHYVNGSDYDIANKGTWSVENEITYYASGNLRTYKTYYNGTYNRYVFEDSNFYDVDGGRGQGRLLRWEYTDESGNTNFNEFEYYGKTLVVKNITSAMWRHGSIVLDSAEEAEYYNEDFIESSRTTTDSEGNTIVATLIISDEYGNPKAYVVKRSSSGSVLWAREFDTYSLGFNVVVAVDNSDNVYAAATKWNGSNSDVLIYSYTAAGQLIGSYQYGGGNEEQITSIIADSLGNIYIAGERYSSSNPDIRDLFIAKLNPDMSGVLWESVYDSGDKDCNGYLTIDQFGNIVLHGRSDAFSYEYFKVAYTSDGVASSAVYDDLEMSSGSSWLGVWENGREYSDAERIGADSELYITYAYAYGTGKTIIEYDTDTESFPDSFGGMTVRCFINAANEDIGYHVEFDNGAVMEAIPIPGSDGGWQPTKFENYDIGGHTGSTWWLFWDVGITIEKTSSGQYLAYSFDADAEDFDAWRESLVSVALPDPIPDLPEFGNWTQYCIDNNILVEFPPLTTDGYLYDVSNRLIQKIDRNPLMDTTYAYEWDYQSQGFVKMNISYDYDGDEVNELIYSKIFANGSDPDISNMGTWQLVSETNYLKGVTYEYYASGRIKSVSFSTPDSAGNLYYHYLDEDWCNQGFGRIDKRISATADSDGAIAFAYTFFWDNTSRVRSEEHYSDDNFTYLVAEYEYEPKGGWFSAPTPIFTTGSNFVIDFGVLGLMKYENGSWVQISPWDPYIFDEWNINTSCLIGFGSEGLYKYENGNLTQLSSWDPYRVCVSGTNIMVDFGPSHGFWKYANETWSQICPESPDWYGCKSTSTGFEMVACFKSYGLCKITENGLTQISSYYPEDSYGYGDGYYIDFGSHGLWNYVDGQLSQISEWDPESLDWSVDANYKKTALFIDFGSRGLWRYSDNSLMLMSSSNPIRMYNLGPDQFYVDFGETGGLWKYASGTLVQASSFGGVYQYNIMSMGNDVIVDFGESRGVWKYSNGVLSQILIFGGAESYSCSQNDGLYKLIMDFGDSHGLWKYENSAWIQMSEYSSEGSYGYAGDTYYDFGSHGLWKYSNDVMTQISEWNPCSLTYSSVDGSLIVDFGAHGLCQYKDGTWSQLSPNSPFLSDDSADKNTYLVTKTVYTYWTEDIGSPKKYEMIYDALGAWQKTIEYYPDGITMHYQWLADVHSSVDGDDVYYEYDAAGNLTFKRLDTGENYTYDAQGRVIIHTLSNGNFVNTTYYASGNKQYDVYWAPGWSWQKTIQYYDASASVMHYQWMADINPGTSGDDVYYEYDTSEKIVQKLTDDGTKYTFMYYADGNSRLYKKNEYSGVSYSSLSAAYYYYNDSTNRLYSKSVVEGGISVTYIYYNNADNRIEARILSSPDAAGNTYYHYEDHLSDSGRQRVDYEFRATLDAEGYILHMYSYVGETDTVAYMIGHPAYGEEEYPVYAFFYSSGNLALTKYTRPVYDPYPLSIYSVHLMDENFYGDGRGRADWKKTDGGYIFYTYWNMTDRIESERSDTQDANGSVWRHYMDEAWEDSLHGRLDTEVRAAQNGLDEIAFKYSYYDKLWPAPGTDARTGTIHFVWSYSDQEQTIPCARYEYGRDGGLISKTVYQTTYYTDSGRIESVATPNADASGYVYYHFINEDWGGSGKGRCDKAVLASPDSNGYSGYMYFYAEGSDIVKKRYGYANADYGDPASPEFTSNSGNGSVAVAWDEEYVSVNTYKNNWVRILKKKISYLDIAKTQKYEQWQYQYYKDYMGIPGNDQNILVRHVFFSPGIEEYFYDSGRLEAQLFSSPDGDGAIYKHFKGEITGRCDILERNDPDDRGALVYVYEFNGTGNGVIKKTGYAHADHSDPLSPIYSGKVFVIGYNTSGAELYEETYYEGDVLKKITYKEPDNDGVLVYEYFYDSDGSGGSAQLVRERRYYGDADEGIVREYIPGEPLPVKIIDRANGVVYRKVSGSGNSLTLKIRYYEDYPESGYPWGSFELGQSGENVYVKDVMVGTHLKQRYFFVSSEDLDLESGIDWGSAVKRRPDGHDWTTPIEVDVAKYSMYEVEPHWEVGEPGKLSNSYPFTYYASGRVKTWFERTVHEVWFTRSEESTERVYEYYDEAFYPEKSVSGFLADLIYSAKGSLSDNGLKYFLSQLDPAGFGSVTSLKAYLYSNASGLNNYTIGDVSDTLSRMLLVEPYEAHGRLSKVTNADGTYKVFEYEGNTGKIAATKTYDIQGRLLEERVSSSQNKEYISMGSLPWVRYGEQLGDRWYDGWHGGFSKGRSGAEELTGYEELRAMMQKWAGTESDPGYVRIFLMSDLRAGVVFDENGVPTGFTDHVYEDMDVLLQVASELNVKLIPALFDYRIADGYSDSVERDFPGFFTDQTLYEGKTKAEWLADLFRPFIAMYGNNENIYAWDVINEPEMMGEGRQGDITGITMDEVTSFVRRFVEMIHEETFDAGTSSWAKVTVGSLTKGDMSKYWISPDNALVPGDERALDFYQFHYYDSSKLYHDADFESLNYGKGMLNTLSELNDGLRYFYAPVYLGAKQVICGELDPTYVQDKLDTIAAAGYDGMIFWDDKGNMLSASELQEAMEWTYGTVTTYDPATGNIVSRRGSELADPGFIFYHYDAYGRIDIAIRKDADEYGAIAYSYEYYEGTGTVSEKRAYHSAEFDLNVAIPTLTNPVYQKNYGIDGIETGSTQWVRTYYADTWYACSETLQDPDSSGVIYRRFLNESLNAGNGREEIEYHPDWGYAYQFQYLGDSHTRIGAFKYSGIDTSSPSNPVLTGFSGYESWSSGIETITYYDQSLNIVSSRMFTEEDNFGNVYYHYLNDNWHDAATNYMRMDSCRRAASNEKGELTFRFQYYTGDNAASVNNIFSYSDNDMANLVAGYEFDVEGRITASRLFSGPNANGESAFRYEYYDSENGYHFVTAYNSTDMSDEHIMGLYEYSAEGSLVGYTHYEADSSDNLSRSVEENEILEKNNMLAEKESQFTGYSPKLPSELFADIQS
ncbi:MAG: S8 family serine peptidase [Candidatus Omnitrophota bacterium]|jgi:YVTN family beta-propeller protein/YD repeat-containing protein